jgi:A/G-specific adenine glycosylase
LVALALGLAEIFFLFLAVGELLGAADELMAGLVTDNDGDAGATVAMPAADGVTVGAVGVADDVVEAGAAAIVLGPPVPWPISPITMATMTAKTPSTMARLTQYVPAGSGPTGCRTPLITSSLGRDPLRLGQARRSPVVGSGYGGAMNTGAAVSLVLRWYEGDARALPWRRPGTRPWEVMVSEFMLQQTPVERVLQPWQQWVDRWPTPSALALAPSGEAVRAWGRLGYPRRALRLHQSAVVIAGDYDDQVPDDRGRLLSLPGVGTYPAAAILSFAFGQRHVVLDTNVRRVLARVANGVAYPQPTTTADETALAEAFMPASRARAARWAVASMELGAVVCTAKSPRCFECPVRSLCAWRQAGYPVWDGAPRRGQSYVGTDRQCRGVLLSVLRSSERPVPLTALAASWPDDNQRDRAFRSLLADGLVVRAVEDAYALPS